VGGIGKLILFLDPAASQLAKSSGTKYKNSGAQTGTRPNPGIPSCLLHAVNC
jgi:hypothetical protein